MADDLCKRHGKPRTVIYKRKMPRGGTFSLVGCADCAAAAAAGDKPAKKAEKKPPAKVTRIRRY